MERILSVAACAAMLVLTATACASSSGDAASSASSATVSATSSESPSNDISISPDDLESAVAEQNAAPKCEDVWVDGSQIDADYTMCASDDGNYELLSAFDCEDDTKLASHDANQTWAVIPGPVHAADGEIAADKAYGKAFDACKPS
ncbi:hypothetical protein IC607_11160 [Cellulomonas sp. JH27-2]|uniref:hypothetical protein n=1 Tax=Cellulomonas sp. JH27-2 TaxID=2774139 RepID=UPI00177DDDF0|nr:hypothetical protein [Cellulomonas sp. JH27-2]MBD8059524.1 hypothetical protein [Cellulomonas sp. JH27-2]